MDKAYRVDYKIIDRKLLLGKSYQKNKSQLF